MGDFRSDSRGSRGGFGGGGRSGGSRGGFGGGRGGFGGGRSFGERRPLEMHDATCSKCQKACQIPFRPTGERPVFCSDCFRNEGGGSSSRSSSGFSPRRDASSASSSGVSQEQFKQINDKLNKILGILEELEIVDADEEGDEVVSDDEVPAEDDGKIVLVEDEADEADEEDDDDLDDDESDDSSGNKVEVVL